LVAPSQHHRRSQQREEQGDQSSLLRFPGSKQYITEVSRSGPRAIAPC
jgi:hypothetical protein